MAQDTTLYGSDLGMRDGLAGLLERLLAEVPAVAWLRIMYAYPQHITPRLIEAMAGSPRVCRYLDLPLQHAHPAVLERMGRPSNVDNARALIARLRAAMPEIALRSSFIVGYPGETEAEFAALLDFLREVRLDRAGFFTYSPEEGTPAAALPGQVPKRVKRARYARAMEVQQAVSLARNREWVGKTLDVLIEGAPAGDRARGSSPGAASATRRRWTAWCWCVRRPAWPSRVWAPWFAVLVTAATEYDLWGEIAA